MKKLRILFISLICILIYSCASLTPCDCGNAYVSDDTETIAKCNEKLRKMTEVDQRAFNLKAVQCIESK